MTMRAEQLVLGLMMLAVGAGLGCGGSKRSPGEGAQRSHELAISSSSAPSSVAAVGADNGGRIGSDDTAWTGEGGDHEEPRRAVALVSDPPALAVVAGAGGTLEALVSAASRARLWQTIRGDIDEIERSDPRAGVAIRGNAHRLFNVAWLEHGRFELVAVVPRLDRIPMTPGMCGELHLLYRLAYSAEVSGETVTSRVPMTVVVVLSGEPVQQGGAARGCQAAANKWLAQGSLSDPPRGRAIGEWLIGSGGPLHGAIDPKRVIEVRLNLQSVRWPSSVRPDLGGHAEYVMRSFRPGPDGVLAPAGLENTPDAERLLRDRALRAKLLAWIRDPSHRAAIDDGTAILPDEFLAKRVVSVTPRGLSRLANRPFRQLFSYTDVSALPDTAQAAALTPQPRYRTTGSKAALLRRLDDLSCAGCHQSRSIAGFHLLGEDGDEVAPGNALAVSISPHMVSEVSRRERLTLSLAAGDAGDFFRAPAERAPEDRGKSGERCGLGDPGFAGWTCADGFECINVDAPRDDDQVGVCVAKGESMVGGPCEFGPIAANANSHRDRVTKRQSRGCEDSVCNTNRVGFPGGMCTASCDDLGEGGACGAIALLTPFNNCLARNTPFPRCLAEHVTPAGLRACDAATPCREDYICARASSGEGTCIPPYFLFQMRVDGHPARGFTSR